MLRVLTRSHSTTLIFMATLGCLVSLSAVTAQDQKPVEKKDPRIGKKVIVTEAGAPLRTPEKVVWKAYVGETFTVALTNGEWLWVAEKGGWLWEKQTVKYDTAISELNERVKASSTAEHLHLRGIAYSAHGKYEQAIADFTASLAKQPNAGVYNNRGQTNYLKNDLTAAISDFNSALAEDPQHFVALNNRALCHIGLQDFTAALTDVNAALAINKNYPEALNNRGVVHAKQGDFKAAVADYTAALKIDDRYADAYGNRSFAYRQQNQFAEAIADLRTAIEKAPLDFKPVNDLAWVLATASDEKFRNATEAVSLATKACQMTQYENWNTMDTLAAAHAANGDFKAAQQWIATALEKAPANSKSGLQEHIQLIQAEQPILK